MDREEKYKPRQNTAKVSHPPEKKGPPSQVQNYRAVVNLSDDEIVTVLEGFSPDKTPVAKALIIDFLRWSGPFEQLEGPIVHGWDYLKIIHDQGFELFDALFLLDTLNKLSLHPIPNP